MPLINGLGALVTAIATAVFLLTKFTEGAWVVVVAVPSFIFLFYRVHAYYVRVGKLLGIGKPPHNRQVGAQGSSFRCRTCRG